MADLKDRASALLDTLGPLHRFRSVIVHGYYQGYTGNHQYMFGIFERQSGPRMVNKAHHFTHAQISQLSSDIETRQANMTTLSADTFQVPLPKARHGR
jgi:hypothetical protein